MSIYKKSQNKPLPALQSPYKKRLIQIAKMANYQPVASIPNINNDFNFTYAKDGILKRKIKQQQQSISTLLASLKSERTSPNSRLPRIDSKAHKIEYHPTSTSQPPIQKYLTLDTRMQSQQTGIGASNVKPAFQKNQNKSKQNNKKRIKNRYQLSNIQSEEESEEQMNQTQYSINATPGPGSYSYIENTSFFNTKKNIYNSSFGSKAERFTHPKPEFSVKSVQQKNPESLQKRMNYREVVRRKKNIPFLSLSEKQNFSVSNQKIPGPQDYQLRYGIQQQLIKKIQRNFKGNFGVYEDRFKFTDQYPNIGPGSYIGQCQNDKNQIASYYFMSQQKRFS